MRLKTKLIFIILILSTLVISYAVFNFNNLSKALHEKEQLEFTQKSSAAIKSLLKAGGHWAVERGVTNAAANAVDPISVQRMKIISTWREKADTEFKNALKEVSKLQFSGKENFINTVKRAYNSVTRFRQQIDAQINLPAYQRDIALTKNIIPTMTQLIISSQNLRYELVQQTASLDPELGRQAEIKHFSWLMSEYAGRERAI